MEGGKISIHCQIENDMLKIRISDTGKGLDENASQAGIGINNVSQRLESIFGNRAGLTLTQNDPQGITAMIKVPI